jgi:hypothetical protein
MATLAVQLAQAESAYHKLLTGTSARVVVDQNGERVEFTAANRSALYGYILDLRAQIDNGVTVPTMRTPIRFVF